jgi:hypothetical protein
MPRCITLTEMQRSLCKTETTVSEYSFHIYHSIHDIPALLLDELGVENHFFFSSGYWASFEQTFSKNIQFRYAVFSKNGEPFGLAPFQLIWFRGSNVANELEKNNYWQSFKKYITTKIVNLFSMRLLVSGNTFITGEYCYFLKSGYELNDKKAAAFHRAIEKIINDEKNISGVLIKDLYPAAATQFGVLQQNGFLQFEVNPNMEITINPEWHSMRDYEQSLSSRYRIRYRKALHRADLLSFVDLNQSLIQQYKVELQQMLHEVLERSDFKLENPDISYLESLHSRFPEHFILKGIFKENQLLGFYSVYKENNCLVACFVGMNKSLLKEHDLYLNILYKLLELAIELKVHKLHYGRTAMEIKSSVGAKPEKMFLYVKHVYPVRNLLVHFTVKILSKNPEWTLRNPFKKTTV